MSTMWDEAAEASFWAELASRPLLPSNPSVESGVTRIVTHPAEFKAAQLRDVPPGFRMISFADAVEAGVMHPGTCFGALEAGAAVRALTGIGPVVTFPGTDWGVCSGSPPIRRWPRVGLAASASSSARHCC